MAELKSIRTSLQEAVEDDTTKRGSAARLALILGSVALCSALFASIIIHACGLKDMNEIASKLIWTIGGGGGGTYIAKTIGSIFNRGNNAPESGEKS